MRDDTRTEAAVVAELATAAADPTELDPNELYSLVLPATDRLELVDLEKHLDRPRRKKGRAAVDDAESFVFYTNAHAEDGRSFVFADRERFAFVSILNGHTLNGAETGWGDHRAELVLRQTPEWQRWAKHDGSLVTQDVFAELIEEGAGDVVEPPAADLRELAQTFQATTSVNFRQATFLDSGARQLTYEETIDARAGSAGTMTVPKSFTLGLRPFEGSEPYKVEARLRFRIRDGKLAIGYSLERPNDVLRAAFDDAATVIAEGTGLPVLRGRPA